MAFPNLVQGQQRDPPDAGSFRFRTGVELINVTATVTDTRGRFVSGLEKADFLLYEDDTLQEITNFSSERVPVSLGIVLDTSGSMVGAKWTSALSALDRFVYELLGPDDEIFIYGFSYEPSLIHGWTSDRDRLTRALQRVRPEGGTALYDAVHAAIPLAVEGQHRKKAILVISDGNDGNSETDLKDLQQAIRESEVLVYAIGIDGDSDRARGRGRGGRGPQLPFPFPGAGGGRGRSPIPSPSWGGSRGRTDDERVNVSALRDLTDDSGGRTEIVRGIADLDPATQDVANELSRQYYLAYAAPGHVDGAWHAIDVEVPNTRYRVRARRGYVAPSSR